MIPIGTIFNRFPRMVRDLAQSQKKNLDFIVEGGETELDRSLIEQIRDPLIHLLRNAVDHGIESPEDRKSAGKPETATVRLSARREQSHIAITVEDDGKGIDGKRVIASSLKKGLISPSKAENLSEAEAINLIFMAGMSTAEKATEVSGRGVGMDIVRANVERLGGSVTVETKVGHGSKFIVRLPLTVAIIQGFLVTAGGAIYVLPLNSIAEALALQPGQIQHIGGHEILRWRDSLVPLVRLNATLNGYADRAVSSDKNIVVVVKTDECLLGLLIDEVMEPQEVVVKSLGNYLGDIQGVAGATILGDGRVALILDVASLSKQTVQRNDKTKKSAAAEAIPAAVK
jgi:two-component system chemotaxis sensor kinase CheA